MKFSEHVKLAPLAVKKTFEYNHCFLTLQKGIKKIYVVGSGSSYSQAIYLVELINRYLPFCAIYLNPYSFVRHSNFTESDVCIHFTQEAKRNDNICPIKFAKRKGGKIILFTAKINSRIEAEVDECYKYGSETSKILVASMSYASGYVVALKYVCAQLKKKIKYDVDEIVEKMEKALKIQYSTEDVFTDFLYAGLSYSVAVEGALKTNECLLQDREFYELKHYSHGKHFVSWNNNRLFNIMYHKKDQDLVDLYKDTIFEDHHTINYMRSDLLPEVAVFEWMAQMLAFITQSMENKGIELKNIPIHNRIKIPHGFTY